MMIKNIPFEEGSLETMINRLYKTMDSMEKQWSKKTEPSSEKQIHTLEKIAGLEQNGKNIPLAYLLYLKAMGNNDNGLLEQEWDGHVGNVDVTIDSILKYYSALTMDVDTNVYLPFLMHKYGVALYLKLTEGQNPSVHYLDAIDGRTLFSGSFEKYLFQSAFRKAANTQFLYQVYGSASINGFRDILSEKFAQDTPWTKPMEFIEAILSTFSPCQLQKAWFSDDVRFYSVSSEYIISVDLHEAFNMQISSDNHIVLQNLKESFVSSFGNLIHLR